MRAFDNAEFDRATVVGPFDPSVVSEFQDWLHESDYDHIEFEPAYIECLTEFHGAVPRKPYFTTANGTEHAVTRFLNFLPRGSSNPMRQYSVAVNWSDLDDRLGPYLMPFAELFAGDFLCFDYQNRGRPSIVVWFHERSFDAPSTEFVAIDFDAFFSCLRATPT